MSVILFIITAFVMFSLALILIARFVILLFLIIVAPVGFAGLAIPKLERLAGSWWSELFEQTITAPVLLLLLYIALRVITDASFLTGIGGQQDWTGFVNGGNLPGFAGATLSFLIVMGLLLAVAVAAKRMSAFGGGWAMKTAGNLSFGVAAWGVNRTVGRVAYRAGRGLRQNAAFNAIDAATGRIVSRQLDAGAKGSFDLRSTGALKGVAGGIDAGTPAKDGFVGARDRSIKSQEEAAKSIEKAFKEAGPNKDEAARINQATAGLDAAEKVTKKAQEVHKDALSTKNSIQEEVDRLTKEDKEAQKKVMMAQIVSLENQKANGGSDWEARNPAAANQLKSMKDKMQNFDATWQPKSAELKGAQQRLATASGALASASRSLAEAEGTRKGLESEKKEAEKVSKERIETGIKEGKKGYAAGLQSGFGQAVGFFAYGPDQAAAARKIKDSLKDKSAKDTFTEAAKALAKEEEGEHKEEKKEEKHEEAHAPAKESKPSGGGGGGAPKGGGGGGGGHDH